MPSIDRDAPRSAARRLRVRYITALTVLAVLVGAGHLYGVRASGNDDQARLINIAGRQRMLSQAIARRVAEVAMAVECGNRAAAPVDELGRDIEDFEASHAAIRWGDRAFGLTGHNSPAALALLDQLEADRQALVACARDVLATVEQPGSAGTAGVYAAASGVRASADAFLPRMHALVGLYEGEADAARAMVERLHLVLLLLTGAALLIEALFVFEPSVRLIRRQMTAIVGHRRIAEEALATKERFLANISHEIRTPLSAILGYVELARREGEKDPEQRREHLAIVQRNGEHLLALINDILDLAKFNAGKMPVRRATISPVEVVADVVSTLRGTAAQKSLRLDAIFEGPIPETIEADALRVRQALMNLVGNALKFTDTGSVRVVVRCERDGMLAFDVADTGPGLTEDEQGRIFSAFSQADEGVTRRHGGTGLGLTLTQRIAEALGGSVSVRSTPGQGSVFTLRIQPGATGRLRLVPGLTFDEPTRSTEDFPSLEGLDIVLAEDGEDNRRLIAHLLRTAGARVHLATHGREAINLLHRLPDCHLVLMDMHMPVLDGPAATKELREVGGRGARVPIVALTAAALPEDRAIFARAGCDDFLSKPVDRGLLLRTCRTWARTGRDGLAGPGTSAAA